MEVSNTIDVAPGKDQLYSQATERFWRDFRDQHGRYWGASCEKKTQAPCGPLSLQLRSPRRPQDVVICHPPLIPPGKYARLNIQRGEIFWDYDAWIADAQTAREEYDLFALEQATLLYGNKGPQAIEENDPALLRRVGAPPPAIEQILAAKQGNHWVLGLDPAKPKWAFKYWPDAKAPEQVEFPSAAEESEPEPEGPFPKHVGGGAWMLSDGSKTAGRTSRSAAEAAEAAVHAGAGVDPSWET